MSTASNGNDEITQLLAAWHAGDESALAALLERIYGELRQIAAANLRREHGPVSVQPSDLVSDLYLRLQENIDIDWNSRGHFYATCSKIIRRILIDRARRRKAQKRGGGIPAESLDDATLVIGAQSIDLLALDMVLKELATFDPRKAALIELRFFGRLTIDNCAAELNISPRQVNREWRFAKAWLAGKLAEKVTT